MIRGHLLVEIQQGWPGQAAGEVSQQERSRSSQPLDELAHVLAPAAGSAVIRRRAPSSEGSLRLVCFPYAGNPRLLLPADSPRAAATAVRLSGEGSWVWKARVAQLAALGVSAGLLSRPPVNALTLAIGNGGADDVPLLTYLSEIVGEEVTVSVRIRPHRPNSKPVLLLIAVDGRVLGYAKVGGNSLTRTLVRNESSVLNGFGDEERERLSFDVPRVLHHGSWHDLELLVVTALRGGRGSPRDPERRAMREIAARSQLDYIPLEASRVWTQMWARLAGMPSEDASVAAVVAAGRALSDRIGDERLLFGGWHGDWTPWNMSSAGERLSVWDWERSSASAPIGLDVAHHLLMVANHRRRLDGWTIRRLGRKVEPIISDLGQASRHAPLLIFLALLEMAVRFEEARAAGMSVTNRFAPLLGAALTFVDETGYFRGRGAAGTSHHAT